MRKRAYITAPIALGILFALLLIGITVVIGYSGFISRSGTVTREITPVSELLTVSNARLDPAIAVESNDITLVDNDPLTVWFIVTNISDEECTVTASCSASAGLSIGFVDGIGTEPISSTVDPAATWPVAVTLQFTADDTVTSGSYTIDFSAN